MSDERMFPVLFSGRAETKALRDAGCPMSVPWSLLAPHEAQAKRNHDQTLERLAERGGLSVAEMVLVLTDEAWRGQSLSDVDALPELLARLTAPGQTKGPR